jgi:hypothetical protein
VRRSEIATSTEPPAREEAMARVERVKETIR